VVFVLIIGFLATLTVAIPVSGVVVSLVWLRTEPSARKITAALAIFCGSTLTGMLLMAAAIFVVFIAGFACIYDCSSGFPWG
jgi:hypothetical protein